KLSTATILKNKPKLISFTKDASRTNRFNPFISDETYFKLIENEFVDANNFPNTGYSLNVNKASYSNVRRFINMKSAVPPDAVRVEEMVNYFNLGYQKPESTNVFKISTNILNCPWNKKNNLLFIRLSAKKLDIDKLPAGNFTFLIDISGSMDMPNRLPLLKESFQLFVKNLRAKDMVSIVTYGGTVGTWLEPTPGNEKEKICNRLELLEAAGETNGESGIEAAYKMARKNFIYGGNNRVILATDGDFNVGQTSEKALDDLISKQRESGIFLTCLGVGMGNFKDSKLQTLAKRGNGNYAYLDNLQEAEKVLVHELTETLYSVAENAFINIKFDPNAINNYRLIGFDNKRESILDGSSELDGGEIGSGCSTMAIFEYSPKSILNTSLGQLVLKYHDINNKSEILNELEYEINVAKTDSIENDIKFATAVTMFGLKLKESVYLKKTTWADIKNFAISAVDKNIFLQNDFLNLLEKAILLYEPTKKKARGK
ncbi:MAG: von Willebrand factor type A domain-containing protein, partial [Ferruginibacter sp.]